MSGDRGPLSKKDVSASASGNIPDIPPAALSRHAKTIWRRVRAELIALNASNQNQIIGSIDRELIQAYCQAAADWNASNRLLQDMLSEKNFDKDMMTQIRMLRKDAEKTLRDCGDRLAIGHKARQRIVIGTIIEERDEGKRKAAGGVDEKGANVVGLNFNGA